MDWLACDCVQLFVSLFSAPSGWGGSDFFFVVIFWTPAWALLFVGLWWFVLLVRFGLFTAFSGFCCSENLFVESLILAQDERWRRA